MAVLKEKGTFEYDSNGNEITGKIYNPSYQDNEEKYTYKYDYDKNGNWIKRTEFVNYNADNITERDISYY